MVGSLFVGRSVFNVPANVSVSFTITIEDSWQCSDVYALC